MLEKMADFFHARLDGYEEHMLTNIQSAAEFYPVTASLLPAAPGVQVLDLGCGTGLELRYYYPLNPTARVTGIDMAPEMLRVLEENYRDKAPTLICGSYFEVPFGENRFDAAVSVESLHHFPKEEKIPLYRKLHAALKDGGYFILTDYFAENNTEEQFHRRELIRLMEEAGLPEGEIYHYDTPLTAAHEVEALIEAGFSAARILGTWGATALIRAEK